MANLTVVAKINRYAKSLDDAYNAAVANINVLKAIKVSLTTLNNEVNADGDFDQAAKDSVQTVITTLLAEIASL